MPRQNYFYCESCQDYSTTSESCDHSREFIFSEKQRRNLSKFLSYILRHHPNRIGIELDSKGFTQIPMDDLITILKKVRNSPWISRKVLDALIFLDLKGRFEIRDDRIHARYGHSLKYITVAATRTDIPDILYHGTNLRAYQQIKQEGLKPMGRNLVHLTTSLKDAEIVGRRHKGELVILEIDVQKAIHEGIQIWQASSTIFVSNQIPAAYIKINS